MSNFLLFNRGCRKIESLFNELPPPECTFSRVTSYFGDVRDYRNYQQYQDYISRQPLQAALRHFRSTHATCRKQEECTHRNKMELINALYKDLN
ncbi:Hypothetical predicted protein [Pelobates cultripes]|nr:Hypothetical predicted protein [Pelobates cultripes]